MVETIITLRCSHCCMKNINTVSAVSSIEKTSKRTGKVYCPKIHGLRHCKQCSESLRSTNRDFNAARNIFFMFYSLATKGITAPYLARQKSDVRGEKQKKSKASVIPSSMSIQT